MNLILKTGNSYESFIHYIFMMIAAVYSVLLYARQYARYLCT